MMKMTKEKQEKQVEELILACGLRGVVNMVSKVARAWGENGQSLPYNTMASDAIHTTTIVNPGELMTAANNLEADLF